MTPKQHYNLIVRKALALNTKLRKLEKEAEALIEECDTHRLDYDEDDYTYSLAYLSQTLEELASFDLEDAIPDKAEYEY